VASALAGSGGVALAMNGSIAADNLSVASYGALSSNPGDTTGVSAPVWVTTPRRSTWVWSCPPTARPATTAAPSR
jgi:hypothetical protein